MATRGTDVDGGSSSGKDWVQSIRGDLRQVAETKRRNMQLVQRVPPDRRNELTVQRQMWGLKPVCTMFRVPPHLRDLKPENYTPSEISLGLFDRNPMTAPKTRGDELRLAIAQTFLEVVGKSEDQWMDVCELVVPEPGKTQDLYDEIGRDRLSLHEIQSVLTLDAIFLTCFLGENARNIFADEFISALEGCLELITDSTKWRIVEDILKVENQIPFKLIQNVVHILPNQDEQARTFFLRNICVPVVLYLATVVPGASYSIHDHAKILATYRAALASFDFLECDSLLDCGYRLLLHNDRTEPESEETYEQDLPSATRLRQAGIEFRGFEGGFDEVRFEPRLFKAVLHLPTLRIGDMTESLWRNLLAFEQMECNDVGKLTHKYHQFGSFIEFMDNLIDDDIDVLLLTSGNSPVIRYNGLGTHGAVAQLFNNRLLQNCLINGPWLSIKKEIFAYYKWVPRQWYVELKRTKFGKPWFVLSFLAAISLLIAANLQAVYTILGYYYN